MDLGDDVPRMGDFAVWAVACEVGAGGDGRTFLDAYAANRRAAHELAVDVSPVSAAVIAFMSGRDEWAGSPTELLNALNQFAPDTRAKDWPKAANKLTNLLRILKPDLRRARGIEVDPDGHDGEGFRLVQIRATRPDKAGKASSGPSGPSATPPPPDDTDGPDDEIPDSSGCSAREWRYSNDPREDAA